LYYGSFVCLHFARFLHDPIVTEEQRSAYEKIITFLDSVPSPQFPDNLGAFWDESVKALSAESINQIIDSTRYSIENPDLFLSEKKDEIERYMAFKQSDEYKNSPMAMIQAILENFNSTSGYYDVFIPAMKRLSKPYAEYSEQIEIANAKLLQRFAILS